LQQQQQQQDQQPSAVSLFLEGHAVVFAAVDLPRVKPHLPPRGLGSAASDDRRGDIGDATAARMREAGVAAKAFDANHDATDGGSDDYARRLRKRMGLASKHVGLSVQWGAEKGGRSWAELRACFEKLEKDAATEEGPNAPLRFARGVDAGAGDSLTHREYVCSHPFYAASLPEVCAA
jgi:hypothetical protein